MPTRTKSRRASRPERAPSGIPGLIGGIRAEIGACALCPALRPHRKLPPESFGTTRTGYVLVGDAAGSGPRPFDGASGETLREALLDVGDDTYRDLEDLFFLTQAVRCDVSQVRNRKSRTPTRTECRNCLPYLQFEIRALHPRLVLAVGSRAATAVLGEPVRINEVHGRRHRSGDTELLPLLAPSPHNRVALKRLDMTIEGYRRWLTGLFGALIDDLAR